VGLLSGVVRHGNWLQNQRRKNKRSQQTMKIQVIKEDAYIVGDSFFAVDRETAARFLCLRESLSEHNAYQRLDMAILADEANKPYICYRKAA
jgi:hypothetical protein